MLLVACPADDATGEDGPSADSGVSGTTFEATTTETGAESGETGPGGLACEDLVCGDSEWCDYTDDECSNTGFSYWSCEARPESCDANDLPVCGCDGQLHANACAASMAGVDLDAVGRCTPPEGTFSCGPYFCTLGVEYCSVVLVDLAGEADGYACVTPETDCMGEITCDCLVEEQCSETSCEATPDGGVEIRCPGI